MPCYLEITCPTCKGSDIIKSGFTKQRKQRYFCQNLSCEKRNFILDYSYKAYCQNIKEQIIDMAINASGIRDTIRVLKVARNTVSATILEKSKSLVQVNPALLFSSQNEVREVRFEMASFEAEVDEQWSYVEKKSNQRWLWYAIDHATSSVLAYVLGKRKDDVFKQLKEKLSVFNITKFYTDNWGAYERNLKPEEHQIGKENTQKIERKNLNFRTRIKRLARKTICFSKCEIMHDAVIGLYVNAVEFGINLHEKLHI